MNIICKKKCLDANNLQYVIGGIYKYYETDYVFAIPYNEKLFNIYLEVSGEDIFTGTGTLRYISENFDEQEETIVYRCVCMEDCFGANAKKYKKGKTYRYSVRNRQYKVGEDMEYVMCDDSGCWLGYVKMSFIKNKFVEYNEYESEFLEVDELFDSILKGQTVTHEI